MSENNYSSYQTCHTGQREVIAVGGVRLYAGGRNRAGGWQKMNPLPDLAMGPSETLGSMSGTSTVVPHGWSCEVLLPKPPLFVSFDWPDFSIPKVSKEFWYALASDIKKNNIKRISCQCAGGHGRTGVQLAILTYIFSKDSPAVSTEGSWDGERREWASAHDLIMDVRSAHCEHAVEAVSQQEYIAMVTGLPMGASAIKPKKAVVVYDDSDFYDDLDVQVEEYKKPKSKKKKAKQLDDEYIETCPVCDSTNIDDTHPESPICIDCDVDLEEFAHNQLSADRMCVHCGGDYTLNEMMPDSDVCRCCHAESLNMKVQKEKIQCKTCRTYVESWQMFAFDSEKKDCAGCCTGTSPYMKKKLEREEAKKNRLNKPKDLDKMKSPKRKKAKDKI
tara:strand:- start:6760 stop:7926 length:1167 start_codon:yes stop_codon:yes gene_type:complete